MPDRLSTPGMLLGKVCQPGPPLKVFSQLDSTVDVQGAIAAGPGREEVSKTEQRADAKEERGETPWGGRGPS